MLLKSVALVAVIVAAVPAAAVELIEPSSSALYRDPAIVERFNFVDLSYLKTAKFTAVKPGLVEVGLRDQKFNLPTSSATPEPASWALMIGGFGFVGAALRRRVKAVAA